MVDAPQGVSGALKSGRSTVRKALDVPTVCRPSIPLGPGDTRWQLIKRVRPELAEDVLPH